MGGGTGCSSALAARAGAPHSFTASALAPQLQQVQPTRPLHPAPAWKWHSPQGQRQVLVPETSKWADPRVGPPGFRGHFKPLRRFQRGSRSRVGFPTTRAKPALEELSAHVSRGGPVPGRRAGRRGTLTDVITQGRPSTVIRCEWGACRLGSAHRREKPGRLCPLGSIFQLRAESGGEGTVRAGFWLFPTPARTQSCCFVRAIPRLLERPRVSLFHCGFSFLPQAS